MSPSPGLHLQPSPLHQPALWATPLLGKQLSPPHTEDTNLFLKNELLNMFWQEWLCDWEAETFRSHQCSFHLHPFQSTCTSQAWSVAALGRVTGRQQDKAGGQEQDTAPCSMLLSKPQASEQELRKVMHRRRAVKLETTYENKPCSRPERNRVDSKKITGRLLIKLRK